MLEHELEKVKITHIPDMASPSTTFRNTPHKHLWIPVGITSRLETSWQHWQWQNPPSAWWFSRWSASAKIKAHSIWLGLKHSTIKRKTMWFRARYCESSRSTPICGLGHLTITWRFQSQRSLDTRNPPFKITPFCWETWWGRKGKVYWWDQYYYILLWKFPQSHDLITWLADTSTSTPFCSQLPLSLN